MCAYLRHYHPIEFITSYLNNAASEEDIRRGTEYANLVGLKVTMPKWGASKSHYFYNKEKGVIAKGLSSVKYLGINAANEIYELAHSKEFKRFVDVLVGLENSTSVDSRQVDVLIKIDFFSEFGNQRELLRIAELFYGFLKRGNAKRLSRSSVDGTALMPIVQKYSVGTTKVGGVAKSYVVLDMQSVLEELEDAIKAAGMEDLGISVKVKNFADLMGYVGYVSGIGTDRPKLFIQDLFPLKRRNDGERFGYKIFTKSIGSGIESEFTVFNSVYDKNPISKGDLIYCKSFRKNGKYFTLNDLYKITD